jgi:hypothetical protein
LRAFALKALTAVIAFAFGLGLAEVALRLIPLGGGSFRDTQVAARSSSPRSLPDWRSRLPPGPKPAGVFRILSLGDSFAWGDGVHQEDAYPDRLERRLNELGSEVRFQVVNWSRPGWNSELQWRSVEPTFEELEPDLVLIGFVLNDAKPSNASSGRSLSAALSRRSPQHSVSRQLHRYSSLYRILWERLENTRQRRAFSTFYHALCKGKSWQRTRRVLQVIHDRATSRGAPVVLVIFPAFDSQLDDRYSYADIHRTVKGAGGKIGLYVLDLLPTFRGVDARRLANYPFTRHPVPGLPPRWRWFLFHRGGQTPGQSRHGCRRARGCRRPLGPSPRPGGGRALHRAPPPER